MKLCILQNETLKKTSSAVKLVQKACDRLGIETLSQKQAEQADIMLVLGGDGSVLRAVRAFGELEKPFLNINIGTLGYLTAATLETLEESLRSVRDEEFFIEERSMLRAQVRRKGVGPAMQADLALNDLVITRSDTGRVVELGLEVDGEMVTDFLCDGLILATPTGSTAYSLAAGGPILLPTVRGFVVNVICPHTLTSRPLVLPEESVAVVRVGKRATSPLSYSVDGCLRTMLKPGDTLTAVIAAQRISLITLDGHNPFEVMRCKLGWSGTAPDVHL